MIKLTIVTPTYNRAKKLARNFESVLAQSVKDVEHIIVDNMSEDGTEELVREYQKRASFPVLYIREPDFGMYNAINKGITKGIGKWIHILNSDDAYYSEKSVKLIVDQKNDRFDIVTGSILVESVKGEFIRWMPYYDKKLDHYSFPHVGTVIKREFYERHGLYDERFKIVSDSIYNIKNYHKLKYLIIEEILVIMGSGGMSGKNSFRNSVEFLFHLFWYHKFPPTYKIKLAFNHIISLLGAKYEVSCDIQSYAIPVWWRL